MGPYKDPNSILTTDLIEMQRQYHNSEYEFLQFNEIIPFNRNPLDIYSPKLVNLSLYLGPQILGMFEIIKQQTGVTCSDEFPSYYKALNVNSLLSSQGVILSGSKVVYRPFPNNNPKWWQAYNKIKHKMPVGIFQATFENIINMIGGLFILHHIADVCQRDLPTYHRANVLDSDNWLKVHTVGQYIYYKDGTGINSTLYESFASDLISVDKRFLPYLQSHSIQPNYQH